MTKQAPRGRQRGPAGMRLSDSTIGDSYSAIEPRYDTLNFQSDVKEEQCRPPSLPLSAERPSSWYVASICVAIEQSAVRLSRAQWAAPQPFWIHISASTPAMTLISPCVTREARQIIHSLPSFCSQRRPASPSPCAPSVWLSWLLYVIFVPNLNAPRSHGYTGRNFLVTDLPELRQRRPAWLPPSRSRKAPLRLEHM